MITTKVLSFWFGDPQEPEYGTPRAFWFQSTPEIDQQIRDFFGDAYEDAKAGRLDAMLQKAEDCLALVIILDQFPRNMFRGKPQSFATDGKALEIAKLAVSKGFDKELSLFQAKFLYLPYMHSENLDDQRECVRLFEALGEPQGLDYARKHMDIIARFGRFPHRNAILGRINTPEEIEFLAQPGSSF